MSAKMDIRDAIIIAKQGEKAIRYRISDKTGQRMATFCVGVKKYDPTYTNKFRYNNFFVTVPSDLIDKVEKLNLRRNSMVHIIADFDYSKDVLEARDAQGNEEEPDYGISRLVTGVILTLIDIEFAGTSSGNKQTNNVHNTPQNRLSSSDEKNLETKQLDSQNITDGVATNKTDGNESGVASAEENALPFRCKRGELEKELGIGIIDLDVDDIFKGSVQKKERKFF